jgi:hypothetical protein
MQPSFRYNMIKGHMAKEVIRGLLEDSEYKAYPFGYESLLSQIRYDIQKRNPLHNSAVERMRTAPDLIVYDERSGTPLFTEVKFRNAREPACVKLKSQPLRWYQKYWGDSVLIAVVPCGKMFYAQFVKKLFVDSSEDSNFDLTREFEEVGAIFTNIDSLALEKYRNLLLKIKEINGNEEGRLAAATEGKQGTCWPDYMSA